MAIVVTHKQEGGRFVVLGASYAKWLATSGHWMLGDWAPQREEGAARVLVVAGADGRIQFGDADAFTVVAVDGQPLAQALGVPGG